MLNLSVLVHCGSITGYQNIRKSNILYQMGCDSCLMLVAFTSLIKLVLFSQSVDSVFKNQTKVTFTIPLTHLGDSPLLYQMLDTASIIIALSELEFFSALVFQQPFA